MSQPGKGQGAGSGATLACVVRVTGVLWGGGTQPAWGGDSLAGAHGSHLPCPALSTSYRGD